MRKIHDERRGEVVCVCVCKLGGGAGGGGLSASEREEMKSETEAGGLEQEMLLPPLTAAIWASHRLRHRAGTNYARLNVEQSVCIRHTYTRTQSLFTPFNDL